VANPVLELRHLLSSTRTETGKVLELTSKTTALIATSSGSRELPYEGTLAIGDIVMIKNGRAAKRRMSETAPVYFV